jgi:hypothetical protein
VLSICHQCKNRSLFGSVMACRSDGRNIVDHVASNVCPLGKFGMKGTLAPGPADFLRGAVGIAKAIAGTGGATDGQVKARTEICDGCEHAKIVAGVVEKCDLCGCVLWAKVRNAGERCPAGKW